MMKTHHIHVNVRIQNSMTVMVLVNKPQKCTGSPEEDVKPSLDLPPTSVTLAPLQSSSVSSQFYQSDDFFLNLNPPITFQGNANIDKAEGLLDRILLQPTVVENNKYEKYFLLFLVVP